MFVVYFLHVSEVMNSWKGIRLDCLLEIIKYQIVLHFISIHFTFLFISNIPFFSLSFQWIISSKCFISLFSFFSTFLIHLFLIYFFISFYQNCWDENKNKKICKIKIYVFHSHFTPAFFQFQCLYFFHFFFFSFPYSNGKRTINYEKIEETDSLKTRKAKTFQERHVFIPPVLG